jgi:hypothetical protein
MVAAGSYRGDRRCGAYRIFRIPAGHGLARRTEGSTSPCTGLAGGDAGAPSSARFRAPSIRLSTDCTAFIAAGVICVVSSRGTSGTPSTSGNINRADITRADTATCRCVQSRRQAFGSSAAQDPRCAAKCRYPPERPNFERPCGGHGQTNGTACADS